MMTQTNLIETNLEITRKALTWVETNTPDRKIQIEFLKSLILRYSKVDELIVEAEA